MEIEKKYKKNIIKKESDFIIEPTNKTKKVSIKKYLPAILLVLVISLGISTFYFYRRTSSTNKEPKISEKETKLLIEKVNKLVLLPNDETPTIATVSDPEKLKEQSFFIDAKVGYKVLIYTNARKAILYDPEINKIINIAPINNKEIPQTTSKDS